MATAFFPHLTDVHSVFLTEGDLSAAPASDSPSTNPRRAVEFALGRAAAARALRLAGDAGAAAVERDKEGCPLWPEGFCGSITHSTAFTTGGIRSEPAAMAVAGATDKLRGLGIDMEHRNRPFSAEVGERISVGSEREWVAANPREHGLMLMTGKEALFKALYPITRTYFSFPDAELSWDSARHGFRAILRKRLSEEFREGCEFFLHCGEHTGFLLCCIAVREARGSTIFSDL